MGLTQMIELQAVGTFGQGLGALAQGVDHFEVIDTAEGPTAVALSATGGGLVTVQFGTDGQAAVADTQVLSAAFWSQSTGQLSLISTANGVFAGVASEGGNRLLGHEITGGQVGAATALEGSGLSAADGAVYGFGTQGYLFAARSDGVLQSFAAVGDSSYELRNTVADTSTTFHAAPGALDVLTLGGRDFVVTACQEDTGISVYAVDAATGALTHTDAVGTEMGLGLFQTVVDVKTASVDGQGYALVVTRSESSDGAALSVIAINAAGQMQVTDHILDNLFTRFGTATELEVVQHGSWTYVLAAGGDSGVSLFALSATGRLVHLDTLESQVGAMLDSVSGMAAAISGAQQNLQILLARHTETGFTQLQVDLAAQGEVRIAKGGNVSGTGQNDLLSGSAGDDTIDGGAGDDALEDGAGQDVLRGGAGADTFLMVADGQRDVIQDFEAGRDRIDLSDVPFLYSMAQIEHVARPWGASIIYRGETLDIYSADGGTLEATQIAMALSWVIDRPLLQITDPDANPAPEATNGADTLTGSDGDDRLQGLGGDDLIDGGLGDDIIYGGGAFDTIHAGAGNDTVSGDDGRDRVFLDAGDDLFNDNAQDGVFGRDTVFGGAGHDTINGGGGDDEFHGDDGDDQITGGPGSDIIYGGGNFDTIHAGSGNDTVFGGDGRDRVFL
ncbi:MAG: calcium-binding protein, partial [Pseudomonadota bacterium]